MFKDRKVEVKKFKGRTAQAKVCKDWTVHGKTFKDWTVQSIVFEDENDQVNVSTDWTWTVWANCSTTEQSRPRVKNWTGLAKVFKDGIVQRVCYTEGRGVYDATLICLHVCMQNRTFNPCAKLSQNCAIPSSKQQPFDKIDMEAWEQKMSQLMRLWYLLHGRSAKAQTHEVWK